MGILQPMQADTDSATLNKLTKIIPKRLFRRQYKETESFEKRNKDNKINNDIESMNLEILLLNTLIISAVKVQTVVNQFMIDKTYTSIFCFTETKVDSLNFKPVGLKIFSKHRKKREKKGGLMIG